MALPIKTLAQLVALARLLDYTVNKTDGEYRVAPKGRRADTEPVAYYTDDLEDAAGTLLKMTNRKFVEDEGGTYLVAIDPVLEHLTERGEVVIPKGSSWTADYNRLCDEGHATCHTERSFGRWQYRYVLDPLGAVVANAVFAFDKCRVAMQTSLEQGGSYVTGETGQGGIYVFGEIGTEDDGYQIWSRYLVQSRQFENEEVLKRTVARLERAGAMIVTARKDGIDFYHRPEAEWCRRVLREIEESRKARATAESEPITEYA